MVTKAMSCDAKNCPCLQLGMNNNLMIEEKRMLCE